MMETRTKERPVRAAVLVDGWRKSLAARWDAGLDRAADAGRTAAALAAVRLACPVDEVAAADVLEAWLKDNVPAAGGVVEVAA